MQRIVKSAAMAAIAGSLLVAGVALATPGSGIIGDPVIGGRGAFPGGVVIDVTVTAADGTSGAASVSSGDVVVARNIVSPGGSTGWHSHPGPTIATVVSGTLTLFDADDPTCTGHDYTAGQVFVELPGDPHLARNLSETEGAQIYTTFLGVPTGESPRTDEADPGNC